MTVPPEITAAILAVRNKVTALQATEFNKHDNYNYVPIDTYYKKVASIAADCGLVWTSHQDEFVLVENQGREKNRLFLKLTMRYTLLAGNAVSPDHSRFSILLPHAGAQTTGIAVSYADKVFMRTTFCVPTGEQDADAEATVDRSPPSTQMGNSTAPMPAPVAIKLSPPQGDKPSISPPPRTRPGSDPEPDADGVFPEVDTDIFPAFSDGLPIADKAKVNANAIGIIVETFKQFMPRCTTEKRLKAWHADNAGVLDVVQEIDPASRQTIQNMFMYQFDQLQKKGK